MNPSSSTNTAKGHQNALETSIKSVDARTMDQSQGHTFNIHSGGSFEIRNGAEITINSQTVLEELPPLPRCPAPCSGYVRRKALEDHMSSYFSSPSHGGHRRKRYVLHGLGGSGKTQGGLNFIDENVYSREPTDRRFSEAYWVDATSEETITKSLEDIARSTGGSKFEDALHLLASHNSKSNWIILFNNADDPSLDLTKYFPKCTHGNIIITTRNRQAARYGLGPESDYAVSGMELDEAKELFTNQARLFNSSSTTIHIIDELIKELYCFPLSVRQAGAYIFATSCTPAEYLDKFRTRRKQLLRKHNEMNAEDYQYGTVETTLSLSFAKLTPEGQRLLQLFAWLHREYILEKIFRDGFSGLRSYKRQYRRLASKDEKTTIASMILFREKLISAGRWDVDKFRQPVTELTSFSLVITATEQQAYSIHPLVQVWTRSAVNKMTQTLLYRSVALLLGSAIRKNLANTTEALSFVRGLAPHIDEVLKGGKLVFDGCKNEFGRVYENVGRWEDEMRLRERYSEACEKALGQKHLKTNDSMVSLASTYRCQGKYEKAAEIHSEVLEMRNVKLGVDHPDTLSSMYNLALTYRCQGKYEKAAEIHSEVLEMRKVKLGVDHPDTLSSMNNLASTYQCQGKYEKAAEIHSEVLEMRKVKLGVDHPDTLRSMHNLALTYHSQGKYEKAAEIRSEVLEMLKVKLGVDHPDTLTSMNNLASTYRSQGKYEKAAEIDSEVLEMRKVKLGVDHPDTLTSMNNLASTYRSQGKYEKAAEIDSEVLEMRKVKLGVDHPDTLRSMNNLALTYHSQGKYEKAAEIRSEVLEMQKVKLGVDHPDTLRSMNNLAITYSHQGKYKKAAEILSEALEMQKVKLGVDHPDTLTIMNNLVNANWSLKNLTKESS